MAAWSGVGMRQVQVEWGCECEDRKVGEGWARGVADSVICGYLAPPHVATGGESLSPERNPYSEESEQAEVR